MVNNDVVLVYILKTLNSNQVCIKTCMSYIHKTYILSRV
jgi:hypothetical protein